METLVRVQAEKATAKSAHDKETIFAAIGASEGGFTGLNVKVKDQLRAWLLQTAQHAVSGGRGETGHTHQQRGGDTHTHTHTHTHAHIHTQHNQYSYTHAHTK